MGKRGVESKLIHLAPTSNQEAAETEFWVNNHVLQRLYVFNYLGRLLSSDYSDFLSVTGNHQKDEDKGGFLQHPRLGGKIPSEV